MNVIIFTQLFSGVYLLLIFALGHKSGLDAVAGLEERTALGQFTGVVCHDSGHVACNKRNQVA